MFLRELQDCQSVVRAMSEIAVALIVNVSEHLSQVLFLVRSIVIHTLQERDECLSQAFANERPLIQPSKEVAGRDVVLESFLSAQSAGRRDIQFVLGGLIEV